MNILVVLIDPAFFEALFSPIINALFLFRFTNTYVIRHCRSNGKGIDKDTFLQYFPLHGLLGDRLFAQFDTHKRGYIDFDEFICGLATVCRLVKTLVNYHLYRVVLYVHTCVKYGRGTLDDKIHFVFNMYDVSHDNTVRIWTWLAIFSRYASRTVLVVPCFNSF